MERKKSYDDPNEKVGTRRFGKGAAMYNHHLATFVQVADSGSFMKAGEKLHISANAVTKQINLLEQHLDVKLFERSTQGLVLTEVGKLIYQEATAMMKHSDSVVRKAREMENRRDAVIRVGVSLMNTGKILLAHWAKAAALHPNIKLQIVPFEDSADAFSDIVEHFGKKVDVIACTNRSTYWDDRCSAFDLMDLPFGIAVSKSHHLADREIISVTDLYDETLVMMKRGRADSTDVVRDALEREHPAIHIQDIDYFEFGTFNEVVAKNTVMLSAACWADVHPLLVQIPVDWPYTVPYGLIYAKEPTKEVLQFIMAVGQVS